MSKNEERTLNRTERLFAEVLLLQNRPNMTSRDLAEHFGVTRRTIFRDLRALGEAGVPLTYAEDGGYAILEGYQLPPLMLTAQEAATLLVGTAFTKLQPDPSLRQDADEVALKIRSVLPDEVREYIDRIQERTVLDPYWQHSLSGPYGDEHEGRWYQLSKAAAQQYSVSMQYYVPSRDELTRRTVDPLGLVYYTDRWNVIAYDHLRDDIRNFRLDRIRSMHVTMNRFDPPEGFDLEEHLESRSLNPDHQRIVIDFDEAAYERARRYVPAQLEDEQTLGDGRIRATFYFNNLEYIAQWLLRYGAQAVVQKPDALREMVRERALDLASQYE